VVRDSESAGAASQALALVAKVSLVAAEGAMARELAASHSHSRLVKATLLLAWVLPFSHSKQALAAQ